MITQKVLEIVSKYPLEWAKYQADDGDDLTINTSPMFAALYHYFFEVAGIMPYRVAKDGDPDVWIQNRLEKLIESQSNPNQPEEDLSGWKL